jgi:hypothetical protein
MFLWPRYRLSKQYGKIKVELFFGPNQRFNKEPRTLRGVSFYLVADIIRWPTWLLHRWTSFYSDFFPLLFHYRLQDI